MKITCTHCDHEYDLDEALLDSGETRIACTSCRKVFLFRPEKTNSAEGELFVPQQEQEKEMDRLLAEMEETLAGLEKLELQHPAGREPLPAALETGVPPEMNDLKAVEVPEELLFEPPGGRRRGLSFPGFLLLVALLLLLAGQVVWIERDRWIDQPRFRSLAERWCPYLGCTLPAKKTKPSIAVVDSSLEPAAPNRYRLKLLLRNGGSAPQLLPAMQVTLTDDQQKLVGRRTFEPPVYTSKNTETPLEAGESLEVELLLAAPSERVTGFEVALVPAGE